MRNDCPHIGAEGDRRIGLAVELRHSALPGRKSPSRLRAGADAAWRWPRLARSASMVGRLQ